MKPAQAPVYDSDFYQNIYWRSKVGHLSADFGVGPVISGCIKLIKCVNRLFEGETQRKPAIDCPNNSLTQFVLRQN